MQSGFRIQSKDSCEQNRDTNVDLPVALLKHISASAAFLADRRNVKAPVAAGQCRA